MKRFDLARLGYKSILGGEMKIITYIIPFIFMIMSSTSLASTDSLFFHKMTCEDAFDDCDYKSVADWFKGTSTNHVFQRIQAFAKDFLKK